MAIGSLNYKIERILRRATASPPFSIQLVPTMMRRWRPQTQAVFIFKNFLEVGIVALLFIFGNYYLTID